MGAGGETPGAHRESCGCLRGQMGRSCGHERRNEGSANCGLAVRKRGKKYTGVSPSWPSDPAGASHCPELTQSQRMRESGDAFSSAQPPGHSERQRMESGSEGVNRENPAY